MFLTPSTPLSFNFHSALIVSVPCRIKTNSRRDMGVILKHSFFYSNLFQLNWCFNSFPLSNLFIHFSILFSFKCLFFHRTDTTIILATCVGVEIGCLLNYQLNIVQKSTLESYSVILPDWRTMGKKFT